MVAIAAAAATGMVLDRLQCEQWMPHGGYVLGSNAWWTLAALLLVAWYWLNHRRGWLLGSYVLLAGVAMVAAAWHHTQWNEFATTDLGFMATQQTHPCCIEAVAAGAPQRTAAPPRSPYRAIPQGEKSQLRLEVARVRNGEDWQTASGRCELIVDGHLLDVRAFDRVLVYGQLRAQRRLVIRAISTSPSTYALIASCALSAAIRLTAFECSNVAATGIRCGGSTTSVPRGKPGCGRASVRSVPRSPPRSC